MARGRPRAGTRKAASRALALLSACGTLGCWEQVDRYWFSQMKKQPAVQAMEGFAPLVPPEGTVPMSGIAPRIAPTSPMAANPMLAPEAIALPSPFPSTPASVERGKEVYGVYCQVCHAADGMAAMNPQHPVTLKLAQSGAPPFPLASTGSYTDGQIFTKIRYGKPLMPGYPQISEEDRWHVVHFLRTLFPREAKR